MNHKLFKISKLDLIFGKYVKNAFLELDNGKSRNEICKKNGQIVAVQNVNFYVNRGEILVIMGQSGSGKSSLLRCLNGMYGRDKGTARGKVLFCNPEKNEMINILSCKNEIIQQIRKKYVSMVFQNFGLMPWKSVIQNVEYPLEIMGIKKNKRYELALEKLKLVGLTEWKNRFPSELSGGMQQRVGLARAFVTDAEVLLMDEPFSALDPLHKKNLQDEILALQSELHKTIIFVTHDFNEALKIGNRIAIMDSAQILQIGTAKELIYQPASDKVKQFTSESMQAISHFKYHANSL